MDHSENIETGIAIIAMSGRFPGARDPETFWENLKAGVESISFFSDDEIQTSALEEDLPDTANLVKAQGILEDIEYFDAGFFGFSDREAQLIDPQQRLFLECAWEALERAGYDSERYEGRIGVFAGASMNRYFFNNLQTNPQIMRSMGTLTTLIANDKDFLPMRVSFKLNLKGPSINVQTACSTSLVAVHVACQSLLNGECDMALAGGTSIRVPQKTGYLYQEAGMMSPDGHCRAFDAKSRGTVFSNGVGIVALKRFEDALEDGDQIYAVIRGSAVNNDGSDKIAFTAPSLDSQAEVVAEAQAVAGVEPRTVSLIEAHGTGTELGDPIEVGALTRAFRKGTGETRFCALGSVKTNVGHLDAAAGVAGLIKAAWALYCREIPPSLFFETPNPKLDLPSSPFWVPTELVPWEADGSPRRAGVSSLGVGGTNVHVVLEEAPERPRTGPSRVHQLLVLSARSATALETLTDDLASHLRRQPELDLADVAFTLQTGRRRFGHRRILVTRDVDDAAAALESRDPQRVSTLASDAGERPVIFLFPGQGAQYPGMAAELYEAEPAFRRHVDDCVARLRLPGGADLRSWLFPPAGDEKGAPESLRQTSVAQPAIFVIEYALARLWMSWGIRPQAMVGHSVGEYVAACLAGVMSLDAALALVATRGRLMQSLPAGAMLGVSLSEEEILPRLGGDLSLAAVNAPRRTVVAGPVEAIEELSRQLQADGVDSRRLHTSHAFHSAMMEPILGSFGVALEQVTFKPPTIPYLSNLTGNWIAPDEATRPDYWQDHLRRPVRFADSVRTLLQEPSRVFLEVGPGTTLSTFVRQHPDRTPEHVVLSSLRHPRDPSPDLVVLLRTLGRLWQCGVEVDVEGFFAGQERRRQVLPTYPFERRYLWIESRRSVGPAEPVGADDAAAEPVAATMESPSVDPRAHLAMPHGAARDDLEQKLVLIWGEILGVAGIGIHDNYFELGGDSVLGLRIVVRAGQEGLRFTPRHIFEHPTIAELARAIERIDTTDAVPMTPAQQAFFARRAGGPEPAEQVLLARVCEPLEPRLLPLALTALARQHEALRLFVAPGGDDDWQIHVASPEMRVASVRVDLTALHEERRDDAVQAAIAAVSSSLELLDPPLWRVALFELGARPPVLLWCTHSLVVDASSWSILLEDLSAAWQQLGTGRPIVLPPAASWRSCVRWWHSSPLLGELRDELDVWTRNVTPQTSVLPIDQIEGRGEEGSPIGRLRVSLGSATRHKVAEEIPAFLGLRPEEVVLAALARVLTRWAGHETLWFELEARSREAFPEGPDLSRTVGGLNSIFSWPLTCSTTSDAEELLVAVKEQLRAVPRAGVGEAHVRHLVDEPSALETIARLPRPEVAFRFRDFPEQARETIFEVAAAGTEIGEDRCRPPREPRSHLLEVEAELRDDSLEVIWTYDVRLHDGATVQALADDLVEVLKGFETVALRDERAYSPSDFPEAELDQEDLDSLIMELRGMTE